MFPLVDDLVEQLTVECQSNTIVIKINILGCHMYTPQYNRAAMWLSVWILLCLLPVIVVAAELSKTEQAAAKDIGDDMPWQPTTRSNVALHPLNIQTLSIEADWKKHTSNQRLARVYQYNHNQQTSRLLVIDINSQLIVREQAINSVHLPLNDTEIDYAKSLLDSNRAIYTLLNRERAQRSLEPVFKLTQYDVKASIYEPDNTAHVCALQRCVLFALVDQSLTVSSIEPLVSLHTGQVLLLRETLRQ
jgi:hypothetical protein